MREHICDTAILAMREGVELARRVPGMDLVAELTGFDKLYQERTETDPLVGQVALVGSGAIEASASKSPTETAATTAAILSERKLLNEDIPIEITTMVPEVAQPSTVRHLGHQATLLAEAIEEYGVPKPLVTEVPIVVRANNIEGPAKDAIQGIRRHYEFVREIMQRTHGTDPKMLIVGNIMHLSSVFEDIRASSLKLGRFAVLTDISPRAEKSRFVAH
jgi:hypothetical protein